MDNSIIENKINSVSLFAEISKNITKRAKNCLYVVSINNGCICSYVFLYGDVCYLRQRSRQLISNLSFLNFHCLVATTMWFLVYSVVQVSLEFY